MHSYTLNCRCGSQREVQNYVLGSGTYWAGRPVAEIAAAAAAAGGHIVDIGTERVVPARHCRSATSYKVGGSFRTRVKLLNICRGEYVVVVWDLRC